MRFHYSILLFVLAQPVFAESYGYALPESNGTDTESYRRAQADLQRQKDWLRQREIEQRGSAPVRPVYAASATYDRDSIYACLMKVTATPNLRPVEEARRKVNCYPTGVGLVEDCKSSVHATMRLSTNEETAIKNLCN